MKTFILFIFIALVSHSNAYGSLRYIADGFAQSFREGPAVEVAEETSEEREVFSQTSSLQIGDTLVTLYTTYGNITIRLFPEKTPLSYENFTTLARQGFFDNVIFHRVIENFMIQTGDPTGTGTGSFSAWGHTFSSEPSYLTHIRGAVSMAHAGIGTYGSQFFIVHEDAHFLNLANNPSGHTVFGQVIDGMDVVDRIAQTQTDFSDRPIYYIYIIETSVFTYEGDYEE